MSGPLEFAGCPGCGTLQHLPEPPCSGVVACTTCRSILQRTSGKSLTASLALAAATFLCLLPANFEPFLTTSVLGVSRQSVLASSAAAMLKDGWPLLATLIFLFVIIFPLVRFGLLTLVLGMLRAGRRPAWLGRAFRYADELQTWAMPDVFLLGLAVAYARLRSSINVEVGWGAWTFIVAGVLSLLTRATLDKAAVWRAIQPERPHPPEGAAMTCTRCDWLAPAAAEGRHCPRCGARMHLRKPESVMRASALTLAAFLFYIPANLLPLATLPIGLTPTRYTVLEGVIDLIQANLWALALLVLTASFAIPFLKLVGLGWCLSSIWRRSPRRLRAKTRLYHVVEEIGRWSMVDPFVIACFVPVMQYNAFIYGRAEPAASPFTMVVILTMLATKMFDPRRMWDAAEDAAARPSPAGAAAAA